MNTRKHEFSLPIDCTPEQLWKALTEGDEITRWFCPSAEVTPGDGGSIRWSWGEGIEAEGRIEIWEPEKRLSVRTGDQAVDYFIDSGGGGTVLRVVHSGFGEGASFDDEYESTRSGWTVFLNMLKHALERHPNQKARNVSITRHTDVPRLEAWERIVASGELTGLVPVPDHPPGYGGFMAPALNDSYLAIFCEGKGKALVTVTWILYGYRRRRQRRYERGGRISWASCAQRVGPTAPSLPEAWSQASFACAFT